MALHRLMQCGVYGCALLISACTSISSSSFSQMSSSYRGVVEQYTNDNILLNIVRTSQNMPMSFLDIPSIVGTGSVIGTAGIGADIISGDPASVGGFFSVGRGTVYKPAAGMSVENTFNFTQASLDNSQFMAAFLKQVPLETINFRGTEDNLPKQVLYSLLIDSIEIRTSQNDVIGQWKNNPRLEHYDEFQALLYLLVDLGLKGELRKEHQEIGPLISEGTMLREISGISSTMAQENNLVFLKKSNQGKTFYQLAKEKSGTHVCINKHAAKALLGSNHFESSYCQDSPDYKKSYPNKHYGLVSKLGISDTNLKLVIRLRSTGNVFNYLGEVMSAQLRHNQPYLVTIKSTTAPNGELAIGGRSEFPLFKVYKNDKPSNPIYSVEYRGDQYFVNGDDETYSSQVLEFVSTLITANKLPGTTPPAPALVIR